MKENQPTTFQAIKRVVLSRSQEAFFLLLLGVGVYIGYESFNYSPNARIFPLMIVGVLNVLLVIQLLKLVFDPFDNAAGTESSEETADDRFSMEHLSPESVTFERELRATGWILSFGIVVYLLGFLLAIPLYLALFLKIESEMDALRILIFTLGVVGVVYLLFVVLLESRLYSGVILSSLGVFSLRSVGGESP